MNSEWLQIVRHPEQSEGSLLCGRTHESPSPPALAHRREREPVEESATGQWRTLEAATHKPGALGSLVHKRVYTHTNGDATPDAWADYTYGYDAVGNVYCVWDDDGNEVFYFAQDAFGNELPVDLYGQDSWSTARTLGINEHQTGKWLEPFTGLYYFHARWNDPAVGRFVGRSARRLDEEHPYAFCESSPAIFVDPSGRIAKPICSKIQAENELRNRVYPEAENGNLRNNEMRYEACGQRANIIAKFITREGPLCCWEVAQVTRKNWLAAIPPFGWHTVTVLRQPMTDGSEYWSSPSNLVVDDWDALARFTGLGVLRYYSNSEFVAKYPYLFLVLECSGYGDCE